MHDVKRVTSVSKALDLAILEVEYVHRPVVVASIDKTGVGDKVIAIGNPSPTFAFLSINIANSMRISLLILIISTT